MNFRPVIHRKYPKPPTYTNEFNGSGLVIRCIQCVINYLSIEPKSRQKNIMSTNETFASWNKYFDDQKKKLEFLKAFVE